MFVHHEDEKTGEMYGTCITSGIDVMNEKMSPVLRCDLCDYKTFLKTWPMSNSIFIFPESIAKLQERFQIENKEEFFENICCADKNEDFKIGYKIINNDIEVAKTILMALVEGLYFKEFE